MTLLAAAGILLFSALLRLAPKPRPEAPATIHLMGFGRVVAVAATGPIARPGRTASSILIVATRSSRAEDAIESDPQPGENP